MNPSLFDLPESDYLWCGFFRSETSGEFLEVRVQLHAFQIAIDWLSRYDALKRRDSSRAVAGAPVSVVIASEPFIDAGSRGNEGSQRRGLNP